MRVESIERARAAACGHFWLPCPVCGQMFGGHERGGGILWQTEHSGTMTCPNCPGDYTSGILVREVFAAIRAQGK